MLVHCVRRCGHRRGENGELEEEGGKTEVGIKKERGETWNDSSKTDGWTTCQFPGSCVNCGADFFCCFYSYFCVLPRAAVNESPMTRPLPPRTFVYPARQIAHELLNQACVLLCTSVHFQKLFKKNKIKWSSLWQKCNYGCIYCGHCKNSLCIDFFFMHS